MKKKMYFHFILMIMVFLFIPKQSYSQANPHELLIPQVTGAGQYLNEQIMADSNANGTRKDPDRIYVLERGGMYLVNTPIRNSGWVLRIKAKDGAGKKPKIFLFPNATSGNPPGQCVDVRGNVNIKNVVINGCVESDPTIDPTDYLGKLQGALFNTTLPNLDIVIDSCILNNTNGNHVRTDNAPRLVKITNSIFGDMGKLPNSNLGGGKAIDVRGGSVDSLVVVNNTFVNAHDRIVRHFSSTAPIKYFQFDHNTIVNVMGYHGLLSLGKIVGQVKITNNLLVDAFALGSDTDAVRQAEFTDSGEKDAWGNPRMTWVIASPNDTTPTTYTINNNFYALSTDGQKFLTDNKLTEGSILTYYINRKLGKDSTTAFKKVDLSFPNVPAVMIRMMNWYRSPTGANKTKSVTNFTMAYDFDRRTTTYFTDTLNCAYSTSNTAYTGAVGGFPAGDLNWFPSKKAQWILTGIEKLNDQVIPKDYSLDQNYPNPFNPTTNIVFSLPKESNVTIKIFNSIGQEIQTLLNDEKHIAGKYNLNWNGKDASGKSLSTGLYFYQLKTEHITLTKKMMLIK